MNKLERRGEKTGRENEAEPRTNMRQNRKTELENMKQYFLTPSHSNPVRSPYLFGVGYDNAFPEVVYFLCDSHFPFVFLFLSCSYKFCEVYLNSSK